MKINTKKFKEALSNTLGFVSFKSTIPLNTYLGLKTTSEKLLITTYSQEGLTSSFLELKEKNKDNNQQEQEFSLMVTDPQDLSKIVGTINTAEFDLLVEENLLTIKNSRKVFQLGVIEYESTTYEKNKIIDKLENINLKDLQQQLSKVNKFVSNDQLRPILNGVNINEDHLVATNQFYLYKTANTILGDITAPITLDYAFINKLAKVKGSEFVNVIITEKTFTVQSANFVTTTRLVEGDYPNYKAIIPKCADTIIVDKIDLTNALKEATITSNQSSLLIELEIVENLLHIKSRDIDFRKDYSSEMEVIDITGPGEVPNLHVGIKASFMLELLSTIDDDDDEVVIQYKASNIAILLHGAKEQDKETLGLLMPMMLN